MKKVLFFIVILFLIQPVFGVTEKYINISYDDVVKQAINNSHDLKIADFNVLISKTGVMGARSEYFPKLNFNVGTEYTHNFQDVKSSTVTTVGDSFINPYTRYQSILGITLSYNLFDFGVRHGQLKAAKEEIKIQEAKELQSLQELKLNLLDRFSQLLVLQNQLKTDEQILKLEEINLENAQRLLKAKEISKNEVADIKIGVEKTRKEIDEIKKSFSENLMWISFYTGEQYTIENTSLKDFSNSKVSLEEYYDYTKSLIWRQYDSEIKKKEYELKAVKRQNLPKLSLYGRYYIYGSDYSSYPDSLGDIRPSNYTLGGNLSMPVFDGLNNYSNIKRVSLELQEKYVERDKAVSEWINRVGILKNNYIYTQNELNNVKIENLKEQAEHNRNIVIYNSIGKGIEILTEHYGDK